MSSRRRILCRPEPRRAFPSEILQDARLAKAKSELERQTPQVNFSKVQKIQTIQPKLSPY